ncbi:hypothetical protein BV20DRAFT_205266 [Pilatotrama ljubarskyi]|nr:hypothetical protein BV20DRAFT_205266 [Pilatotrama ljubarskyi]
MGEWQNSGLAGTESERMSESGDKRTDREGYRFKRDEPRAECGGKAKGSETDVAQKSGSEMSESGKPSRADVRITRPGVSLVESLGPTGEVGRTGGRRGRSSGDRSERGLSERSGSGVP